MPAVASVSPTGNSFIDGLLCSVTWGTHFLTFSFPASASFYGANYGDGEPAQAFGALDRIQQDAIRAALGNYSAVSGLVFAELAETATQHADLRYAMSDATPTAWAYYPSALAEGGDVWFNHASGWYTSPRPGSYAYATILHETGHALGLKHPHEADGVFGVMPLSHDSLEYTVMSYRSYVGASLTGAYVNGEFDYPQSLMMDDIRAIQQVHGANFSTHSENNVYMWDPATGQQFIDGVAQAAPGANRIFLTIWDGGGIDTYDFSNYATSLKVSLAPGAWSTVSQDQLAHLDGYGADTHRAAGNIANAYLYLGDPRSLIENAIGGSGNDCITGNQAANELTGNGGSDKLYGMEGNDVLHGGAGADLLDGGSGNDVLDGGAGADQLVGGLGIDTVSYAGAAACVTADLASPALNTGDARGDVYSGIENIIGSAFDDVLRGDAGANAIAAGSGNDVQDGRAGSDTLSGLGGDDILIGGAGADLLDGGAGCDTASYATATAGVTVNLMNPRANTGDAFGDTYVSIENLTGSAYSDLLTGNDSANVINGGGGNDALYGQGGDDTLATAAGDDRLYGGAGSDLLDGGSGNDLLVGGAGRDTLVGGTGADIFVFQLAGESPLAAADTIVDFVSGVDRIDLRAIDANVNLAYDQAFAWIGSNLFSGKAGQLRYADHLLSGDVNGDRIADFQVNLPNASFLAASDLWL